MARSGIHAHDQGGGSWRVVVNGALIALSVSRLSRVLGALPSGKQLTLELAVDYLDHAASRSAWDRDGV